MNSTSVPSNNANEKTNSRIVASEIYFTENTLEVPKDAKTLNSGISSYIASENMVISAGNAVVKNGVLELANGERLQLSEETQNALKRNAKERTAKKQLLAEKTAKEKAEVR